MLLLSSYLEMKYQDQNIVKGSLENCLLYYINCGSYSEMKYIQQDQNHRAPVFSLSEQEFKIGTAWR